MGWQSFIVAGLLSVLLTTAFGCHSSGGKAPATSRPTTRVSAFQDQKVDWAPARPFGKDRMAVDSEEGPVYAAVWDRHHDPVLVVVSQFPMDLFGAMWVVEVFGADGKRIAKGWMRTQQTETPFGLFEVRSRSQNLPEKYRDRWILAVGLCHPKSTHDQKRPLEFLGGPRNKGERAEEDYTNLLSLEPVRWGDDDNNLFKFGVGSLYDDDAGRQVRSVESALAARIATSQ